MDTKQKAKGSWGVRFFIAVLAVVLGVLFYWLLSFIEGDIGRIKSPDHSAIRSQYVEHTLDEQKKALDREINDLARQMDSQREQQDILSRSTSALQSTIEQVNKNKTLTATSERILQDSMAEFLKNQQQFQDFNRRISELAEQRRKKEQARTELAERIKSLEATANQEYQTQYKKYQLKVAAMKLAFLVPVFVAAAFLFLKYRTGPYWAMVWAVFLASFARIAFVVHAYFPSQYFKYIALLVVIGIVVRFLVVLIRMIVAPKKDLLIKQYQQHYDKCICPVCSKPIRTGPLRYIGGMKKKIATPVAAGSETIQPQAYTCPSCGTGLYAKCDNCGGIRHNLLPYCEHCGNEKPQ